MMSAHKILPLQDTLEFPILHFFDEAVEWIDSKRKDGHNVLVHCHAGVSRSATIVVAYLMRFKGWTAIEALSYVRLRRERAKPNASFWNQLLEY
jgi:protein-tyrosine phosphatase